MLVNIKPIMNDLLQIRIACLSSGQLGLNVLHYRVTSVITLGATVSEIATALDATWSPEYIAWLPSPALYLGTGVRILTPPASLEGTETGNQAVGANGNAIIPRQASGIIHQRTGFSGPAQRGRIYVPFISALSLAVTGELSVGGVTLLNDIATALGPTHTIVGATGTTNVALVIKHGPSATNPPPSLANTIVIDISAGSLVATQMRRGDYGQKNSNPFTA